MSIRRLFMLVVVVSVAGCGTARTPEEAANAPPAVAECTGCHGDPSNGNAAPPRSVKGATATTDVTVGAHQAHLQPSALRLPIACSECHVVPQDVSDPGHIDNAVASLTWGPLASAQGVTPSPAAGPAPAGDITCANYCHGGAFGTGNGTLHTPQWTKVDGSQAGCGTCHGIPPPPPHPSAANSTVCANCHPGTINSDGTINVAGGLHINGTVDVAGGGGCTGCHGDSTRTPAAIAPAPPRDTQGNVATSAPGVGAHQAHLNAGALAGAIACTECHVVPTTTDHATEPLHLTFGPTAQAYATPASFDAGALTCANYCHGTATWGGTTHAPVWNQGASQAACGTCHGIPSSGGKHLLAQHAPFIQSCATCHGAGYTPTTVILAKHVNGTKDVVVGGAIASWTPSTATTPGTCTANCHSPPTDVRTW